MVHFFLSFFYHFFFLNLFFKKISLTQVFVVHVAEASANLRETAHSRFWIVYVWVLRVVGDW